MLRGDASLLIHAGWLCRLRDARARGAWTAAWLDGQVRMMLWGDKDHDVCLIVGFLPRELDALPESAARKRESARKDEENP